MERVIQVNEDTYGLLQQLARPFDETPNDALFRCLQWIVDELEGRGLEISWRSLKSSIQRETPSSGVQTTTNSKASKPTAATKTPQSEFEPVILRILVQAGGKAAAQDVIAKVPDMVPLAAGDWEPHPTQKFRWRNAVCWRKLRMVREGLLRRDSPIGIWELTEAGQTAAKDLEAQ